MKSITYAYCAGIRLVRLKATRIRGTSAYYNLCVETKLRCVIMTAPEITDYLDVFPFTFVGFDPILVYEILEVFFWFICEMF